MFSMAPGYLLGRWRESAVYAQSLLCCLLALFSNPYFSPEGLGKGIPVEIG